MLLTWARRAGMRYILDVVALPFEAFCSAAHDKARKRVANSNHRQHGHNPPWIPLPTRLIPVFGMPILKSSTHYRRSNRTTFPPPPSTHSTVSQTSRRMVSTATRSFPTGGVVKANLRASCTPPVGSTRAGKGGSCVNGSATSGAKRTKPNHANRQPPKPAPAVLLMQRATAAALLHDHSALKNVAALGIPSCDTAPASACLSNTRNRRRGRNNLNAWGAFVKARATTGRERRPTCATSCISLRALVSLR